VIKNIRHAKANPYHRLESMKIKETLNLAIIISLVAFNSCQLKQETSTNEVISNKNPDNNKKSYSNNKKKDSDSLTRTDVMDMSDLPPTQHQERERLSKTYDQVKVIDSTFIINNDTLKFHLKYYCLRDSNLVIPKFYEFDENPPKDFVTHPFVADISLKRNGRFILSKQFKGSDFNPFYKDPFIGNLKKYGSILDDISLSRNNKDPGRIIINFSFSIPTTDLGIAMSLIITDNGTYKIIAD